MPIRFQCESCGQMLEVEESDLGEKIQCPQCSNMILAREQSHPSSSNGPELSGNVPETQNFMFCPQCGDRNDANNFRCVRCSYILHGAPQPEQTGGVTGVESIIPYKNANALTAYYLGVFSIIPCVGILLAIPAVVLGILGLIHAKKRPDSKGKIHAWVGIIIGGFVIIAYAGLILWGVITDHYY